MHDTRRVRLVLGVLLIAAVALITIDFRDGGTSSARSVGSTVFGPVERVASDVTRPVSSVFDWVTGGPSSDSKIASLQAQNAKLRAELSEAQLSRTDEKQLQSLLQLAGRGGYKIVAASVIAAGQDYTDTVTLDVGTKDGVRAHETVLNGQRLGGPDGRHQPDRLGRRHRQVAVRPDHAQAHLVRRQRDADHRRGPGHLRLGEEHPVRTRSSDRPGDQGRG